MEGKRVNASTAMHLAYSPSFEFLPLVLTNDYISE